MEIPEYTKRMLSIDNQMRELRRQKEALKGQFTRANCPYKKGEKVKVITPEKKSHVTGKVLLPEMEHIAYVNSFKINRFTHKFDITLKKAKKDGTQSKQAFYVGRNAKIIKL